MTVWPPLNGPHPGVLGKPDPLARYADVEAVA